MRMIQRKRGRVGGSGWNMTNRHKKRRKEGGVDTGMNGNGEMGQRKKEGRHLFHITAFNLTQVVKLADNTDIFYHGFA